MKFKKHYKKRLNSAWHIRDEDVVEIAGERWAVIQIETIYDVGRSYHIANFLRFTLINVKTKYKIVLEVALTQELVFYTPRKNGMIEEEEN